MNAEYEKKVGLNIRQFRENKKLTQEQLSAQLQTRGCDITRSALAKIEVGQRHIYIDELRLFKELLDVKYEDLLTQNNLPFTMNGRFFYIPLIIFNEDHIPFMINLNNTFAMLPI